MSLGAGYDVVCFHPLKNLHAFTIALNRIWTDDIKLALIKLNDILFSRVAKDEFSNVPKHKHLGLWFICCLSIGRSFSKLAERISKSSVGFGLV